MSLHRERLIRLLRPSIPLEGPAPLTWWARRVEPLPIAPAEPHAVPTGRALQQRRLNQGVDTHGLAACAGLTVTQLEDVEAGRDTRVSPRQRISDALNVIGASKQRTGVSRHDVR